ncbi:MAG: glycosyltransferase family 39 protein [Nonlabens sp.]|uniref:glycosyltransferase family 39 protein n=1 Tax=Nonlabens sp. TaxID=1888209 RepID=UPI003EF40150
MKQFKELLTWCEKYGLFTVLCYSIIIRLLVFLFYNGITYFPDSGDYIELSDLLLNGELIGYHGARTPGYSMFLAFLGNQHWLVVIVQNLLGLLSLFFIYKIAEQWISRKGAIIIGILLSSYLPFVFYDFAILTESLSAFLLVVLVWYMNKTKFFAKDCERSVYVKLGLVCAALFLVRPFFIYVPFLIVSFIAATHFKEFKRHIFLLFLLLIIPVITLIGWNSFNKFNTGVFMTSSYEGINLTQIGTSFYEKLPEEYKEEREILLKHRNEIVATQPDHVYPMTVWFARKELKIETGLDNLELSLHLKKMSKNLLMDNPIEYGKQIGVSFYKFFGAESTLLWNVEKFNSNYIRKGLIGLWIYGQQYILILLNISFLILSLIFLLKNRILKNWGIIQFLVLLVILGAGFQAMITFGTNSRFCYPFTFFILIFVLKYLHNNYKLRQFSS